MPKDLPSPELLRKLLRYEPETGKLFWRHRPLSMFKGEKWFKMWNTRYSGKLAVSQDGKGYLRLEIGGKMIKAHRAIWAMQNNHWPSGQIDHINGARDDNRLQNLRVVTGFENHRNQKARKGGTSKYPGVSWNKKSKKWEARIFFNGAQKHLGYFQNELDATEAYKCSAILAGFTGRHLQPADL